MVGHPVTRLTEAEAARIGAVAGALATRRAQRPKPGRHESDKKRSKRAAPRKRRDKSGEDRLAFELRQLGVPFKLQFELPKRVQIPRRDGRKTERVWRFDAALPDYMLLVEVDGGVWTRGAHGHPLDITRNMAKRNDAALAGYFVLAFEPRQVKSRLAIATITGFLASRGWKP